MKHPGYRYEKMYPSHLCELLCCWEPALEVPQLRQALDECDRDKEEEDDEEDDPRHNQLAGAILPVGHRQVRPVHVPGLGRPSRLPQERVWCLQIESKKTFGLRLLSNVIPRQEGTKRMARRSSCRKL
jgi:hypothetical protein